MAGLFVKKGDTVQVIAGKAEGLTGHVILANPEPSSILVEGANRTKKHTTVSETVRGT